MKTSSAPILTLLLLLGAPLQAVMADDEKPTADTAATVADAAAEETAEEFDEAKAFQEIRTLYGQGELEQADAKLSAALEQAPDSARLKSLQMMAYMYSRRAGRNEQALEQLKSYVRYVMENAAKTDAAADAFGSQLSALASFSAEVDGADSVAPLLDELAGEAKQLDGSTDGILAAIDVERALQLAQNDKLDEAKAAIDEQVAAAEAALKETPDDASAMIRVASALKGRVRLEDAANGDSAAATQAMLDYLHTQAQAHPDAETLMQRFVSEHLNHAASLASSDPDAADAVLDRIEELTKEEEPKEDADAPKTRESAIAALLRSRQSPLVRLRQQIERTRQMNAIVGQPATYPENVDGWVNGEELTPDALKGKVVLLDFFAVWCGPCIATFPHLREWHEQYADQGLQIIGVTQYYKYGWNAETNRPERTDELEPEKEREAMQSFVEHHELHHPIAYMTDRDLQEKYFVNGIPHAVVIDRQGKVRIMRIGSGEKNAADLKQAIEDCLSEAPLGGE